MAPFIALVASFCCSGSSACLVVLLIAMFPANVYAAREQLTIGGNPVGVPVVRAVKFHQYR